MAAAHMDKRQAVGYRIEDINRWLAEQERSGTLDDLIGTAQ
jgi:hypothetical protein